TYNFYGIVIIFSICSSDRKYFSSTCSSRISDNEHPFSILWYSKILAVKQLLFDIIPQFPKSVEDCSDSPSSLVIKQPFDVFKENKFWLPLSNSSRDFKE